MVASTKREGREVTFVTCQHVCHKCDPSTLSLHEQHSGEDRNNGFPTIVKPRKDVARSEGAGL